MNIEVVKKSDATAPEAQVYGTGLSRLAEGEAARLSFAQEQLWFLQHLEPNLTAYNLPRVFRLSGRLDVQALEAAFSAVIERHAVLRTRFFEQDSVPMQVVEPAPPFALNSIDLSNDQLSEREARLHAAVQAVVSHIFDLEHAPTMVGCLIKLDEHEQVLALCLHHIVSDAWSNPILARDLADAYWMARRQAGTPQLPALPLQYIDYAAGQRERAESGALEADLAYWQRYLGDELPALELPLDCKRPLNQSFQGAAIEFDVDASFNAAIQNFCRAERCTPFVALLAAWQVLLARYSGQDEFAIGVPASGRLREDVQDLVGFFVTTQVYRARLTPGMSLRQLCRQVRGDAIAALNHADVPFDVLLSSRKDRREAGRSPLFQVMFGVQMADEAGTLEFEGLAVTSMEYPHQGAKYELSLDLTIGARHSRGSLEYNTELFKESTARRLADHYRRALEAMVTDADQSVQTLDLLGTEEHRQLMQWGVNSTRYPDAEPVHGLIERQVKVNPRATALIFGDQQLSYGELNVRSNRLAHYLITLGVKPEVKVGIALERSIEMVVGLLGVLKAGGAYVPLDPEYPQERLGYMIEDSGIELLLTQSWLKSALPLTNTLQVLELDTLDLSVQSDHDPRVAVHGENLAYVIYTSGSTGKPKGAANRHHALRNRLQWMQDAYALNESDTVLQKTPFSFDVSVWEFFWPLMVGARLALARPGDHRDPARLVERITAHDVTTLHFVPSMLQAFLGHEGIEACTGLRRVICSGEALSVDAQQAVFKRLPKAALYNLYGPTEAAIDVTHWACCDDDQNLVPIGQPISGIQTWVLNDGLKPVPQGVVGELYLGGAGLARGYLQRAGLTAERFIADPQGNNGNFLYRTGDLVRWNNEGQLEYLGRIDHQVKIRGFRIELGEVEAQLLAQAEIREAVAVANESSSGTRLVAYICAAEGESIDSALIRERLGQTLPDYMVPSVVVELDKLPLNANGKVDRKALPAPDVVSQQDYEPPQCEVEETLASIWSEVLEVERVGRHDNFFELGGHSLLALKLLARIRGQGWEMPVRSLFQYPQLASFARAIDTGDGQDKVEVPPNLIPADCESITPEMVTLIDLTLEEIATIEASVPGGAPNIQDIYPLAPLQEGILFHHMLQQQGDAYITPHGFSFDSRERLERFITSLNQVIFRHDILRTAVLWEGLAEPVQVVYRQAPLLIEWLAHEVEATPDAASVSVAERLNASVDPRYQRIDVRQAPMIRALAAHDIEQDRWLLQLSSHHLVADHTTMELIVEEMALIQRGQEAELPEPVPFRRFVAQARLGVSQSEHEAFFTQMLGDVEEPTAPFGLLDVQGDGGDIEEESLPLPPELCRQIRQQARRYGVSAASLFHLAWAVVLSRTTGRDDVVFGTVLFGRMQGGVGVERALGMFINTLPIRVQLGRNDVERCLRRIHEVLTDLLHHEHASLAVAQQCSGLPGGTPLFSALLNYRYGARQEENDQHDAWEGIETLGGKVQNNYPLTMSVDDMEDGFQLVALVSDALDGQRLCRYMETAVRGVTSVLADRPEYAIRELNLLDEAELLQLREWAVNDDSRIETELIPRLFARQARKQPTAMALCSGDEKISYAELDNHSNRLAAELSARGIGPETRVGLHAGRSIEFVIGAFAVLKAGGTFVPLDPALPGERLAYIAQDAQLSLLLSADKPGWNSGIAVMPFEPPAGTPSAPSCPEVSLHPAQAAYVIYTSGSTGKPKGVVVSHGALANYVQAVLKRMDLPEAAHSLAMVSTVAADLGHTALFGALCSGRVLHLVPSELSFDPDAFAQYMQAHRIDALKIVPSHLQALLHAADPARVLPAHRLVLGGEAASWPLLEQIKALNPACRVLNHYGPTEATVGVLTQEADTATRTAETLPLGRPLANSEAYVLDIDLNPVPVGVAGELFLGGLQIARGYQSRAAHTAERFIASPFNPGERLYRTGDRVKVLKDGTLAFLGRVDDQVKVRGYRVELAEVARVLQEQPGVTQAEVVAREDKDGRLQLHGYVVFEDDAQSNTEVLREAVARVLPDYMVPNTIKPLESLPLTANGKVDRSALPEPEETAVPGYEAPQGEAEETLAEVWAEVLGVEQVGRYDNFFELGGDSILTLQIVARSRKRGLKVQPRQLMERQTVAEVAAVTARLEAVGKSDREETPNETPNKPFALTPVQRWFFEQSFEERHHWNQSVMLTLTEAPDLLYLRQALEAVTAHHAALRLRFISQQGVWEQSVVALSDSLAFERIDLSAVRPVSAAITEVADRAQRSLTLDHPFKAIWMDLGSAKPGRLLLVTHHLVVDGVSWRILLEDLQTAYKQLIQGDRVVLPEPTLSLQQWLQALTRFAQSEPLKAELPYWQSVAGEQEPSLPGNREGRNRIADANTVSCSLNEELTEQLRTEVPQAYRTQINDILLTALARTLCVWDGRDSVLVELEGHGREDIEDGVDLSRTVGWFTSLFPVRLTPGERIDASIKAAKEQLRAIPNKGIGYGVLRYLSEDGKALAPLAYPQITFNYLGQFDQNLGADSLWRLARESAGEQRSPSSQRRTWLDIGAAIHRGELSIDWTYSREIHDEATIRQLSEHFRDELEGLIEHCTGDVAGVTPSDFPLARVTQAQLDGLALPVERLADLYPLSPMQSGMLFHSLYDPQGSAYVNQLRIGISGLDPARFKAAWQAVFERHDTLRTGFLQGEQPLQWVARSVELPFIEKDWRQRDAQENALNELAQNELAQGFDLAEPPLMRLVLVRVSQDTYHFIWTRHHLLLDGWSTSRLISEVLSHYAGQPLPHQQGRYRDYIAWLQRRDENASTTYWQNRLKPLEEPTRLIAALKPARADSGYRHYSQILSAEDTARLSAFAQRERVTVNTLVQGAWALLLQGYTGQRVVTFGATSASRPPELLGVETLLGLFINTVPVVVESQPQSAAGPWLRELQSQNLASREHEYTPLFDIQRWAGTGGQALFDSIIVFENYPVDQALRQSVSADLVFDGSEAHEETNYPLTLSVTLEDRLIVEFSYQGEHFESAQIERLAAHYRVVLTALAEQPERAVGEIELLSEAEKKQLTEWGVNSTRYPDIEPVHRLIERQVQIDPTATALIFDDEHLSYAELNVRCNRLAHYLIDLGAKPEAKVGIAVERSIEMVVGLLAILKAGGAYVPLDPEYPQERLGYMIEDSGIELLLTQSWLREMLPLTDGLQVLELDTLDLSDESEFYPQVAVHGENLAYVIYTSGSTGKPKGVGISHHNLVEHAQVSVDFFGLSSDDRMLQFATLNFDGCIEQLFPPLLAGAAMVLRGPTLWDSNTFHRELLAKQITVVDITTAYWLLLVQDFAHQGIRNYGALRQLHIGGEAMPPEGIKAWRDAGLAHVKLLNTYGPTEATVTASSLDCYPYVSEQQALPAQMPIGTPLAGRILRVVDASFNIVPQGVAGELCIGGELLARGYLNRPDLSIERFVADPLDERGGRLYRTGDLVRWNGQGQLEYLGRIDHQVKIRGFRIELGEVEAQLLTQPEIRETVVVAKESANTAHLVGYVSVVEDQVVESALIRERLGQTLPNYMVPSVIVELDKLPLNANGKVDRNALPELDLASQKVYEPPQGEVEEALAQIWSEILDVDRIGRNDNFFELGGHSLLAIRLFGMMRSRINIDIGIRNIYAFPTLRELSACAVYEHKNIKIVSLNTGNFSAPPLILIHDGQGSILDYTELARSLNNHCKVVALPCSHQDIREYKSLYDLATVYANMIIRAGYSEPYRLCGWCVGGAIAPLVANILESQGKRVDFVGAIDPYVLDSAENHSVDDVNTALLNFLGTLWLEPPKLEKYREIEIRKQIEQAALVPDKIPALLDELTAMLDDNQLRDRARLGGAELFDLFMTGRTLNRITGNRFESEPLRTPVIVWWSYQRRHSDRKRFADWLNLSVVEHNEIRADHYEMVRSSQVSQSIVYRLT